MTTKMRGLVPEKRKGAPQGVPAKIRLEQKRIKRAEYRRARGRQVGRSESYPDRYLPDHRHRRSDRMGEVLERLMLRAGRGIGKQNITTGMLEGLLGMARGVSGQFLGGLNRKEQQDGDR